MGFFNRVFFSDAGKLVRAGAKQPLTHDQLWSIPENYRTPELWDKFEYYWDQELKKKYRLNLLISFTYLWHRKPSLVRAVRRTFLVEWARALIFQTLYGLLSFVNPIILPFMLDYLGDRR